jgi:hypothetical protein
MAPEDQARDISTPGEQSPSTPDAPLPPGFTDQPVAQMPSPAKDFPGEQINPGEFIEAEVDPQQAAQAARAAESAHQAPVTSPSPLTAVLDAPAGSVEPPSVVGPESPALPAQPPLPRLGAFEEASQRAAAAALAGTPGALEDASLVPEIGNAPGLEKTIRCWVGTLPGAPVQNIDLGGINFPLFTESVSMIAGETQRVRHNGCVVDLAETALERIKAALRKKVVRWRDSKRRRGYLVTIPTEQEAAEMAKRGRLRNFRAHPGDEAVGHYVYLVMGGRTSDTDFPPPIVPRQ